MPTLLVRFTGMCAFASDKIDVSKATQLQVAMPDVFKVLRVDPHHPALTFNTDAFASGGESAQTIRTSNGNFGSWPLEQRKLILLTPPTNALKTDSLVSVASIKEGGYNSDTIDSDCLSSPLKNRKPVNALMRISSGVVSATPSEQGVFAKEVMWSLDFKSTEVTFGVVHIDDPDGTPPSETLSLKLQEATPLQIDISDISVQSVSSGAVDHFEAYGALLKDPSRLRVGVGPGVGCQPTRMVTEEAN